MDNIYQSQASSALFQCSRYSAVITDRNLMVSLITLNNYRRIAQRKKINWNIGLKLVNYTCFRLYCSISGSSFFFIPSGILPFVLLKIILAGISRPPCCRSAEYRFDPVTSQLMGPVCLIKTCPSFDIHFEDDLQ